MEMEEKYRGGENDISCRKRSMNKISSPNT